MAFEWGLLDHPFRFSPGCDEVV